MKITFDIDDAGLTSQTFQTKEEWNEYVSQWNDPEKKRKGGYNPQPSDMRPDKFPCLMLSLGNIIRFDNANDEFTNLFIYEWKNEIS